MEQWIREELSNILRFSVPDDLIQYIIAIENENELHEHMKTLLNFNDSDHKLFYTELNRMKFSTKGNSAKNHKKKTRNKQSSNSIAPPEAEKDVPKQDEKTNKKKSKFVSLYSQEGKNAQVVTLKGRHHCDCQASKHALINNCLKCGRVVCKQEGSGPCLFCGQLVCTPEEQKEINAKTKASAKLMESLLERNRPKGWEEALLHRNRLLEYDRTSERRTQVTDDDSDYFNANSVWLSSTEKEKLDKYQKSLHDKKHASRLEKKMTFDFAGRQIIEDKTADEVNEETIREIMSGPANSVSLQHQFYGVESGDRDVAPGVNAPLLQFDSSVQKTSYAQSVRSVYPVQRIQDPELQIMTDTGRCLSMHQPWASLLVEGIKLHEGRTWYSSHRGRLWIAATAKPPDSDVIRHLENTYRVLYPDKQIKFPTFYPTGCLLGCVNVDDCLTQEEYQKAFPDSAENDSPYVFICSKPLSLKLRFPIKGQHKIYSLDKSIHLGAVKCLQKMAKIEADAKAG